MELHVVHSFVQSAIRAQNSSKKYYLTELGQRAYNIITQDLNKSTKEDIGEENGDNGISITIFNKYSEFLQLKRIIKLYDDNYEKKLGVFLSILIVFSCAIISSIFNFKSYLFFFFSNTQNSVDLNEDDAGLYFRPSLFFTVIVVYILLYLLYPVNPV